MPSNMTAGSWYAYDLPLLSFHLLTYVSAARLDNILVVRNVLASLQGGAVGGSDMSTHHVF